LKESYKWRNASPYGAGGLASRKPEKNKRNKIGGKDFHLKIFNKFLLRRSRILSEIISYCYHGGKSCEKRINASAYCAGRASSRSPKK